VEGAGGPSAGQRGGLCSCRPHYFLPDLFSFREVGERAGGEGGGEDKQAERRGREGGWRRGLDRGGEAEL